MAETTVNFEVHPTHTVQFSSLWKLRSPVWQLLDFLARLAQSFPLTVGRHGWQRGSVPGESLVPSLLDGPRIAQTLADTLRWETVSPL